MRIKSENEFWLVLWAIVAVTSLGLAGIVSSYNVKTSQMVASLVESGEDPILSACAVYGHAQSPVCVSRVAQEKSTVTVDKSTTISGASIEMKAPAEAALKFGE